MTPAASALRQRLNQRLDELAALCQTAQQRLPIWRGMVYDLRRRCGKASCHCASGEPHVSAVLADRREGPQTIVPLGGRDLELFQRLTDRYRALRQGRARLGKIHQEMLQILDRLEAMRRKEGERRYGSRLARRGRR